MSDRPLSTLRTSMEQLPIHAMMPALHMIHIIMIHMQLNACITDVHLSLVCPYSLLPCPCLCVCQRDIPVGQTADMQMLCL